MMTLEHKGSNLINPASSCMIIEAGESKTPAAEGSCFELHVGTGDDSTYTINTAGISGLAVYAQHVPIEFERDRHYLYDASGTDIEPVAQDGPKAWEWAGIFSVADASHTWSMQKVDGAYADPSMQLVLIPVDTATEAMLDWYGQTGSDLLGDSCTVVEDGGSMTPAAGGSCFELQVGTGDDSTYTIVTDGISGLAVYAQHVPIEFERDTHYLYDSSGTDIEPVAEESGGGHAGHDHGHRRLAGHRRLVDVDAALHTYEDSCDAVNCFIEAEGCSDAVDLDSLETLQERASKKCHVTLEEATACPAADPHAGHDHDHDDDDDDDDTTKAPPAATTAPPAATTEAPTTDPPVLESGVKPVAALTSVMLVLMSAM